MRIFSNLVAFAMSAGLVAGISFAGNADAATSPRVFGQNPTTVCQSALPVFDGLIRKRPKALQNEGESTAFVTCNWTSQSVDSSTTTDPRNPTKLTMYFISNVGAATVNCTAVLGWAGQGGVGGSSVTKTVSVTTPGSLANLVWTGEDFLAGATVLQSSLVGVSCSLPAGVGMADSYLEFNEEIGT